jgi:hypothetical protein
MYNANFSSISDNSWREQILEFVEWVYIEAYTITSREQYVCYIDNEKCFRNKKCWREKCATGNLECHKI